MNDDQFQFLAFSLFVLASLITSSASFAAVTVTPSIPDFRPHATGGYFGSTGKWVPYVPASNAYTSAGRVTIGGKPLTIPASIPVAATAGSALKTAMRLSPYAMLGSAALAWLAENGIEPDPQTGVWHKFALGDPYSIGLPSDPAPSCSTLGHSGTVYIPEPDYSSYSVHKRVPSSVHGCTSPNYASQGWLLLSYCSDAAEPCGYQQLFSKSAQQLPVTNSSPATPADFDALPDPTSTPGVIDDAQGQPYMQGATPTSGVPVGKPNYESGNYPMGSPYKAPDGTTVQPMASVTNISNTNTVTISTYNITTHNADGSPTNNPLPQPTEENPDDCETNPDRVGCHDLGTPDPQESLGTLEVPVSPTVTPVGGPGVCPASVSLPYGITWSYQPFCDFATAIKPFILGFAWLSFAYIVVGAVRT